MHDFFGRDQNSPHAFIGFRGRRRVKRCAGPSRQQAMQQQQVAKILTRARAFLAHTTSASRRTRPFVTPVLQRRAPNIKDGPQVFCILRNFSSGLSRGHPPSKHFGKFRIATFDFGRRSGVIIGAVCAAGYLSQAECISEVVHCESDESIRVPPSTEVTEWDGRRSRLVRVIRKLWVPSLCALTISLSWQYPLSLLLNLVFLMWTTKPTPASIYIWVEEMRQEELLKTRALDRMKAQAAGVMHVEVQDNILFCLARVTSLTKRSTLVGFFGDWWVISSSSSGIHTGVKLKNLLPGVGPFPWERRYA